MSTKHTPGPWAVEELSNGLILEEKTNLGIARVVGIRSGIQHAANAQLIAAAPDLLAFIQAVAVWEFDSVGSAQCEAEELIAKATGAE